MVEANINNCDFVGMELSKTYVEDGIKRYWDELGMFSELVNVVI